MNNKSEKKAFLFYPFLIALLPLLFSVRQHKMEVSKWNTVGELILVAFVLLTTAFLCSVLLKRLVKDKEKSLLLTGFLIGAFFSFEILLFFFNGILKFSLQDSFILILWLNILIAGSVLIIKTRRNLENFSRVLQFTIIVFFVLMISEPAYFLFIHLSRTLPQIKTADAYQKQELQQMIQSMDKDRNTASRKPDIYYFIFDRYASAPNLKKYYGYDNSEFTGFLKNKGFFIADQSYSNYPVTPLSITSSTNFRYLDFMDTLYKGQMREYHLFYYLIEHNLAARFLKSQGYTYIYMGSDWEPTYYSGLADANYYFIPPNDNITRVVSYTPLRMLLEKQPGFNFAYSRWLRENHKFEEIAKIPQKKEQTFLFTHILIPHRPYTFGPGGEYLSDAQQSKSDVTTGYLNQVTFVNKKMQALITTLLEQSEVPPVIIIQADEGPYPPRFAFNENIGCKEYTLDEVKIKTGILNAYYLPGADTSKLSPAISPVNTFRLVFNQYFGTDLDVLPDNNYFFSSFERSPGFVNITRFLRKQE